jgi:uncharacterized phage protein (TIGR02216 family)
LTAAAASLPSRPVSNGGDPFPWDEVMTIGLGLLRLSPRHFWTMTPREFAAATGVLESRVHPPERAALARMMEHFPDRRSHG